MSYVSGSTGPTVSGYDTQGSKPLPNSAFGTAYQPTAALVYEKCDRVIINADTGSCFLLYNTTSSIGTQLLVAADKEHSASFAGDVVGGTVAKSEVGAKVFVYATGSYGGADTSLHSSPAQTLDLPIGAVAFSGSDGFASNNITFIKRGGL